MRKIFVGLTLFLISFSILGKIFIIPKNSIRFRILANSNSKHDQIVKNNVKNNMKYELYNLLKDSKSLDETRKLLKFGINDFEKSIEKSLDKEKYSYKIDYGMHYFPEKKFMGKTYPAGNYESLLVTLGKGKGNNWWCILFPPFCLMEAKESEDVNKIEYHSYFKDLLNKIF